MARLATAALGTGVFCVTTPTGARAEPLTGAPEVVSTATWTGPDGKTARVGAKVTTRWQIAPPNARVPAKHPVVRTWIELEPGATVEAINRLGDPGAARIEDAQIMASGSKKYLVVDSAAFEAPLGVRLRFSNGAVADYGVMIRVAAKDPAHEAWPFTWSDPECAQGAGLSALKVSGTLRALYVGLTCNTDGADITAHVTHSQDLRIESSSLESAKTADGAGWRGYTIPNPRDGTLRPRAVGYLRFAGADPSHGALVAIVYTPKREAPRIFGRAGLGYAFSYYHEANMPSGAYQHSLAWSLGAQYRFVNRPFSLGVSGAGLIPLAVRPPSLSKFWLFGGEAELGVHFALPLEALEFSFYVAGHLSRMVVPASAYGLSWISGPALRVQELYQRAGRRSHFTFLRYMPILDRVGIRINNLEIATGGGLQLTSGYSIHPVFATLQVAYWHFRPTIDPTFDNNVSAAHAMLGLQYGY